MQFYSINSYFVLREGITFSGQEEWDSFLSVVGMKRAPSARYIGPFTLAHAFPHIKKIYVRIEAPAEGLTITTTTPIPWGDIYDAISSDGPLPDPEIIKTGDGGPVQVVNLFKPIKERSDIFLFPWTKAEVGVLVVLPADLGRPYPNGSEYWDGLHVKRFYFSVTLRHGVLTINNPIPIIRAVVKQRAALEELTRRWGSTIAPRKRKRSRKKALAKG